jgi:hypothetical protein
MLFPFDAMDASQFRGIYDKAQSIWGCGRKILFK